MLDRVKTKRGTQDETRHSGSIVPEEVDGRQEGRQIEWERI